MSFADHLRNLVTHNNKAEVKRLETQSLLASLMTHPDAPALIELLEGMHAQDYLSLRVAPDQSTADKVRGQAARTDELLAILRGAVTPVTATQRRRR